MNLFFEILLVILASGILLMSRFALIKINQPTTLTLWTVKVFTSALSPLLLLTGLLITVIGLVFNSTLVTAIAGCSVILYFIHIFQTTRPPDQSTAPERIVSEGLLPRRYVFWLPKSPMPVFEQDIPFYTIPGTDRSLLCDTWQPPKGSRRSGLAFIYLHGSAWTFLDKDFTMI